MSEKPKQYQIGIDTFERMRANATYEEYIGMCKGACDKYLWRNKNSDYEDVHKMIAYANEWIWAIENEYSFNKTNDKIL